MKKIVCVILSVVLMLTLFSANTNVFAKNDEKPSMIKTNTNSKTQLYIETIACPQSYVEYAANNIMDFVESYSENEKIDSIIEIGKPFCFLDTNADVYYFPVIFDGIITELFRVYPDGEGYSAAISSFLASELEGMAKLTSQTTPLRLNMLGNDIVGTIGEDVYTLFSYPNSFSCNAEKIDESITTNVLNVKENLGIVCDSNSNERAVSGSYSHYITLSITETQGSTNWCAAYSTAAILRTLGYDSTAMGIMTVFYRRPTSTDSITRAQVVSYANLRGLYPISVESTISTDSLKNELNNNRPVYMSMANINGNHAVVLRGYDSRRSIWSIWNPWFSSYETFSIGGTYIPTGHSSTEAFTYSRTIYNWA